MDIRGNKMKIRIKTYNGELPSYLTMGKVYEVVFDNGRGIVSCESDDGFIFDACIVAPSARLNDGSWEIIND